MILGVGPQGHLVLAATTHQNIRAAADHPVFAGKPPVRGRLQDVRRNDTEAELGDDHEVLSFGELLPTLKMFQDYFDRFVLAAIFVMLPMLALGIVRPTPGGVGGYDATRRLGLNGLYVVADAVAVGTSFVLHALQVSSGCCVLPERVDSSRGADAVQASRPK